MAKRKSSFDLRTLPDISTRKLKCIVTSRQIGGQNAILRAYNYYRIKPARKKRCYEVPLYDMYLSAEGISDEYHFNVVRFGIVMGRRGDYLYAMPSMQCKLIWQNNYMSGRGGWKLEGTKALIHDGANHPQKSAWGAAGCIEVTGLLKGKDAWVYFNQIVRELSGVPNDWSIIKAHKLIQKNQSFTCILHAVSKPKLRSVRCPS